MVTAEVNHPIVIHLGILIGFAALSALLISPLAFHLAENVPGWPGDNVLHVWLLWWFKRALVDLHIPPCFNPFVYVPEGFALAHTEMTWANTLLALPVTTLWGPVVAYNGMLLLSFVLTGFAIYLWVWRLVGNHIAGFVAGIIFAFSPYRMAHFPGHLNLMATQWLPFLLYALEELGRTRRLRFAALAGLFFALNAWASWYYFYFSVVTIPFYVLVRFGNWRNRVRSAFFWRSAALSASVALALIVPAVWPFLRFHSTGEMQHSFSTMEFWAANPTDFFVPNLRHPIWGEALQRFVPFQSSLLVEKNLYLGVIPLLLALVPLLKRREEKAVRALAWVALTSFILALGPTLHWAGQRIHVTVPPGMMSLLYYLGITPYLTPRLDPALLLDMQLNHYIFIPLPMLLFYLFMPFTTSTRAIGRFGVITMLSIAALAGYGMANLAKQWAGRQMRWVLSAFVAGAVLFEFLALPYQMTVLRPRPVDLWLADQPEGVMVEVPVAEGLHPLKNYYATVHQQPMVFGPTELSFPPSALSERCERLDSFPDAESIEALKEYGATYVLVHTDKFEDWLRRGEPWETTGQLHLVRCFDALCVYALGSFR